MEFVLLFAAGLVAGAINALAGGGSFIAFPALLLAGVPPVAANATNTFSALPGYLSGAFGYWADIKRHSGRLAFFAITALIGGFLGAEMLLHVSNQQFSQIVPWLMGLSVLAFAFGGKFNAWLRKRRTGAEGESLAGRMALTGLLALICIYGGFFNAGLGIMLLAFFVLAGMDDIHAMNGLKLVISAVVAVVAVLRFGVGGQIAWIEGGAVFAGTLIGGYSAAKIAHFIPTLVLRRAIVAYGALLTVWFFYKAYAS